MLRTGLLWLSEQPGVFNFIKNNGLARKFASRFVAGEELETAVEAVRAANDADLTATLDLLGESVSNKSEAEESRDQVLEILDRIADTGLNANVSIKLTQMGLDLDEDFCAGNVRRLLERAQKYDNFVRIDMESAEYTDRTLKIFGDLYADFGDGVGTVIQSALYRSSPDVKDLVDLGARVRLVKGAYREHESVAFPKKKDVDAAYKALTEILLARGNYPAIATHDEAMIKHAVEFARSNSIEPSRFEFQMLYGIRRDLQKSLRQKGYNVRIYVPYGTQWYPYLMRRLAERPANLAFILGNVVKETLPGS